MQLIYSIGLPASAVKGKLYKKQRCKHFFFIYSHHLRKWDLPEKKHALNNIYNRKQIVYLINFTQILFTPSFWQVLHDIYLIFSWYLHDLHDIHGICMIFSMSFVLWSSRAKILAKRQDNLQETRQIGQKVYNKLDTVKLDIYNSGQ